MIDADGLATGHATFRETPHTWDSFETSFLTGRGLALVAVDANTVVGWAGISPTSTRDVYRGVGEVSVYVAADRHSRGLGRQLLSAMIETAEANDYWTIVAQVFPENVASLALHQAQEFQRLGIRRKLGKMPYGPFAGRWRDVILLERRSAQPS